MIMERKETRMPVTLGRPMWIRFYNRNKRVKERKLNPFTDNLCARDIVRSHWHLAPKEKWTAASVEYDNDVTMMTSLVTVKGDKVQYLHLTNSNSYSAPSFNIDTAGDLTDIETALSHTTTTADIIYIYNGVTLNFNASRSLLQIKLGQTSAGAAGAGNRYGLLTFNSGITITFDGAVTNTNSGIVMTPTSADASSRGCLVTANGVTFTNSAGANNTANKWTIVNNYGSPQITNSSILYTYGNVFNVLCGSSTRTSSLPIIRNCVFSDTVPTNSYKASFALSSNAVDIYVDFRFNTINQTTNVVNSIFTTGTAGTTNMIAGGVIDYAGLSCQGVSSLYTGFFAPFVANDRLTYADTRQTQIVPADLAFTDTTKGGQVSFTISNAASYAATDEIYIYNATGDTLMGGVCVSKYNADGFGLISGLTDGTAYTLYAKATSDGLSFSAASANAIAVTPTHSGYDFPAINHVTENDTVDGFTGTIPLNKVAESAGGTLVEKDLTFAEESARNTFDGTAANISTGKTLKLLNVDTAGTNDKIFSAADEASRNSLNGTTAADILLTKSVKVQNTTINGELVQKDITFAEEITRNTADSTKYKLDEHFLLHNVDTVGTLASGSLVAPAAPVSGTVEIQDRNDLLVSWAMSATAAYYDVYRNISGTYTKVNTAPVVALEYLDTDLSYDTTYQYKVKAVNDGGTSGFSPVFSGKTWLAGPLTETLWELLKAQVIADTALLALPVKKYHFRKTPEVMANASEFPMVHVWPISSTESWVSFPQKKLIEMTIGASIKVFLTGKDLIINRIFECEAMLKNAIDKDLQFAGKSVIVNFDQTDYDYLAENILDARFTVKITTQPITTGGR